jgi:hypothetical protein
MGCTNQKWENKKEKIDNEGQQKSIFVLGRDRRSIPNLES